MATTTAASVSAPSSTSYMGRSQYSNKVDAFHASIAQQNKIVNDIFNFDEALLVKHSNSLKPTIGLNPTNALSQRDNQKSITATRKDAVKRCIAQRSRVRKLQRDLKDRFIIMLDPSAEEDHRTNRESMQNFRQVCYMFLYTSHRFSIPSEFEDLPNEGRIQVESTGSRLHPSKDLDYDAIENVIGAKHMTQASWSVEDLFVIAGELRSDLVAMTGYRDQFEEQNRLAQAELDKEVESRSCRELELGDVRDRLREAHEALGEIEQVQHEALKAKDVQYSQKLEGKIQSFKDIFDAKRLDLKAQYESKLVTMETRYKNALQKQQNDSAKTLQELRKSNTTLSEALRSKKNEFGDLKLDNNALHNQIDTLKDKIKNELWIEQHDLETELDEKIAKIRELRKEAQADSTRIADLQKHIQDKNVEIKGLEKAREDAVTDRDEHMDEYRYTTGVEGRLAQEKTWKQEAERRVNELETEAAYERSFTLLPLRKSLAKETQRAADAAKLTSTIRAEKDDCLTKIRGLESKVAAAEQSIQQQNATFVTMEEQKSADMQALQSEREAHQITADARDNIQGELDKVSQDYSTISQTMQSLEHSLEKVIPVESLPREKPVTSQLRTLISMYESQGTKVSDLTNALEEKKHLLKQAKNDLSARSEMVEKLEKKTKELENDNSNAAVDKGSLQQQITTLNQQIQDMTTSSTSAQSEWQSRYNSSNRQVVHLDAVVLEQERTISRYRENYDISERSLSAKRTEVSELAHTIDQQNQKQDSMRRNLEDVQNDLTHMKENKNHFEKLCNKSDREVQKIESAASKLELATGKLESELVSRDLIIQEGRRRETRLFGDIGELQQQQKSLRIRDQLAQANLEEMTRKFQDANGQVVYLTSMRADWGRRCISLQNDMQRADVLISGLRLQYREIEDALGRERAAKLNSEALSNENKTALQEMTRSRDYWQSQEEEAVRQCDIARDDVKGKVLDLGRLEEKLRRKYEEAGGTSTTLEAAISKHASEEKRMSETIRERDSKILELETTTSGLIGNLSDRTSERDLLQKAKARLEISNVQHTQKVESLQGLSRDFQKERDNWTSKESQFELDLQRHETSIEEERAKVTLLQEAEKALVPKGYLRRALLVLELQLVGIFGQETELPNRADAAEAWLAIPLHATLTSTSKVSRPTVDWDLSVANGTDMTMLAPETPLLSIAMLLLPYACHTAANQEVALSLLELAIDKIQHAMTLEDADPTIDQSLYFLYYVALRLKLRGAYKDHLLPDKPTFGIFHYLLIVRAFEVYVRAVCLGKKRMPGWYDLIDGWAVLEYENSPLLEAYYDWFHAMDEDDMSSESMFDILLKNIFEGNNCAWMEESWAWENEYHARILACDLGFVLVLDTQKRTISAYPHDQLVYMLNDSPQISFAATRRGEGQLSWQERPFDMRATFQNTLWMSQNLPELVRRAV